jgi:2-polyprenyl-3-methyl-5-hydroxy-6-metoxy-1,4-benzoquinol methylase
MNCAICNHTSERIFSKRILNRYLGEYHECAVCGFVSVSACEQWRDEAYSSAITQTDVGLISRNFNYAERTQKLLLDHFNTERPFLDYAGGYGVFTRLMRDRGFDFYHEDAYCDNLFAYDFDAERNEIESYELITAFEFMEHVSNPLQVLGSLFQRTESLLFSTEIIPDNGLEGWWYLATETGQHISFYTVKSLQVLAEKFNRKLYTNGKNLHIITNRKLPLDVLNHRNRFDLFFLKRTQKLRSRLSADYQLAKNRIRNQQS